MADVFITTSSTVSASLDFSDDYFLGVDAVHYTSGTTIEDLGDTIGEIHILGTIINTSSGSAINLSGDGPESAGFQTSIMIGATGSIHADNNFRGIDSNHDYTLITNFGAIAAGVGVELSGVDAKVINYGQITSTFTGTVNTVAVVSLQSTGAEIVNYGTIIGDQGIATSFGFDLLNTGDILGSFIGVDLNFSLSDSTLFNSGTIVGAMNYGIYDTGSGNVTLTNTGVISGGIRSVTLGDGSDVVTNGNSGVLEGEVSLGGGDDVFINRGLVEGDVLLGNGENIYRGRSGEVDGDIIGGAETDDIIGGANDDHIDGGDGDDTLTGMEGNDEIIGGSGKDTLNGKSGDDILSGGGRSDLLIGGLGDDVMTGGGSSDTFAFNKRKNGDDTITDFENGTDVLDISALGVKNFNWLANTYNALTEYENGVVIDLSAAGGSGSVFLEGVNLASLDASDFIF